MDDRTSRVERFTIERGWLCLFFAAASVLWTVVLISQIDENTVRMPTAVAWSVWMVTSLIWAFGRPGWWKWTPRERAIISDEMTRQHQRSAAMISMVVLLAGLGAGCVDLLTGLSLPVWWPIASISTGAAVAVARFGWLQVRA